VTLKKMLIVTLVTGEESLRDSVLLAASIRAFAGRFSDTPIKYLIPDGEPVNPKIERRLYDLDVNLTRIKLPSDITDFPLATIPYVAGKAEEYSVNETDCLVWLSSETIVLREPLAFQLSETKKLGVRPVHHLLVGSRWEYPTDLFWNIVYKFCGVQQSDIFPMTTIIDGIKIRPYFTKPKYGIFRNWSKSFQAAYKLPDLVKLYEADPRYRVFIHQAILTGIALSKCGKEKLEEIPSSYNYPLHLYSQDVTPGRPRSIEDLTTFRFESTFRESNWRVHVPIGEKLKEWITHQLKEVMS
jgi:hypothetical protein